jgi:hypothetical protein
MSLKNLENRLDNLTDKLAPKIVKYAGYTMEAGGLCGIVYGIFAGDNWTVASSGTIAYFGVLLQRTMSYYLKNHDESSEEKVLSKDAYESKLSKELMAEVTNQGSSKELLEVIISLHENPPYDVTYQFSEEYPEPLMEEIEKLGGKVTQQFYRANQLGANLTAEQILELVKSEYVKEIRLPDKLKLL